MKYRNNYAPIFTYGYNGKTIATFVHAHIGNYWYLTITNELTGTWKTHEYKTRAACFCMITKTVNRLKRIYMQ